MPSRPSRVSPYSRLRGIGFLLDLGFAQNVEDSPGEVARRGVGHQRSAVRASHLGCGLVAVLLGLELSSRPLARIDADPGPVGIGIDVSDLDDLIGKGFSLRLARTRVALPENL